MSFFNFGIRLIGCCGYDYLDMDVVGSFTSVVEDLPQSVDLDENMQGTLESVLRNAVSEPLVGMEFGSLDEVIEFYRKYTYSKGFATMRRNSMKNKGFTEISYINLKCNRERNYMSSVDDTSKKRSTIKNSCKTGIKASMDINDRKWQILTFANNHNHELSPNKARHFAIYKHGYKEETIDR